MLHVPVSATTRMYKAMLKLIGEELSLSEDFEDDDNKHVGGEQHSVSGKRPLTPTGRNNAVMPLAISPGELSDSQKLKNPSDPLSTTTGSTSHRHSSGTTSSKSNSSSRDNSVSQGGGSSSSPKGSKIVTKGDERATTLQLPLTMMLTAPLTDTTTNASRNGGIGGDGGHPSPLAAQLLADEDKVGREVGGEQPAVDCRELQERI